MYTVLVLTVPLLVIIKSLKKMAVSEFVVCLEEKKEEEIGMSATLSIFELNTS
jgi:hypothetical protein